MTRPIMTRPVLTCSGANRQVMTCPVMTGPVMTRPGLNHLATVCFGDLIVIIENCIHVEITRSVLYKKVKVLCHIRYRT